MKKLYFICTVLLLFSCSEDETVESQDKTLPSKSITTRSNGAFFGSSTYTYDSNKLVSVSYSTAESENAGSGELIYEENLLIRTNRFDENDNLKEYTELHYNSDNKLSQYVIYYIAQNYANKKILDYNSDNTISIKTYSGDFDSQTEFANEMVYTFDTKNNITKIQTSDYEILYEYDSKNGIYKNLVARDVLNLIGLIHGALNRGGMNNAISYEFSNNNITDHINLNYTYNASSFPETRIEVNPEFGEGQHVEYIYK